MKIIELLNKIANGEEVPNKIHIKQFQCDFIFNGHTYLSDEKEPQNIYSVVSCSGLKPDIKSGGHYKKFTVNFFKENEPIDFRDGVWTFTIDGVDVSDKVKTLDSTESTDVANNQIKAKLDADNSIIGRVLVVSFESNDGIKSDIEINILGN